MADPIFTAAPAAPRAAAAPWVSGPADTEVPTLLASADSLAQAAQTNALSAVDAIANYRPTIPGVAVPTITVLQPNLSVVGTPPSEPGGLDGIFPAAPIEPGFGALPGMTLPTEPAFDVPTPSIADIEVPDPFSALIPDPPQLSGAIVPVEPGFALPEVPTLLSLALPAPPSLDIPLFEDTLRDSPIAPTVDFAWNEVEYATTLLSTMNSRLVDVVAGASTGLAPEVEAAIWQRGRDREALLTNRAIEEAMRATAARGFTMPQGVLIRIVQQALQDSIARDASLSRDVMIKQAELEQSNFQFAFGLAVQLESTLIGHFNNVQNRAFEGLKFRAQIEIELFNAKVQLYQADVAAFQAKGAIFETRLKGALAQLDIYRAELDGQRTISEINRNQASIYQAQVDGVRAVVEIYRSRVEAVKAQIEADRNKAEVYRAQLQGYDSLVKAKQSEYEGYAARIRAEATKTEMYGQQVGAYRSRVDAFTALVNGKLAEQNFNFRTLQEFPLEVWKGRVSAYGSAVSAEAERLRAVATTYETRVRSFAAVEGAKHASDESRVALYQANITQYAKQAEINIQASIENIRTLLATAELVSQQLRSIGTISGQLAAAAHSARHVSAQISSSTSNSASNTSSNSSQNSSNTGASNSAQLSFDATRAVPTTSYQHVIQEG